jgi:adenosylmethionine-8-amino-7-oxononanoate aminotransferase
MLAEQEKAQLKRTAVEKIIAHWASNEDLAKGPKIFESGQGCYLTDIDGNRYLDTFSSLITSIWGHSQPELVEAAVEQLRKLQFFPNYHDGFTVPLVQLADALTEVFPNGLDRYFFVTSGTEANSTALKMARQYHHMNGQGQRYKVIARKDSYHGTTLDMASYTGFTALREFNEPLIPGARFAMAANCSRCELEKDPSTCNTACLRAMERLIEFEGPASISAMIMDPLPGSNSGYPPPPEGYLQGIRDLCDKHGILLIFDEVQTGFGKTGKWFACEHWNVTPDFLTTSKSLAAGYLPLSVVGTSRKIADTFKKDGQEFRSGGTFGGNPVSCAVALANIELMRKKDLLGQVAQSSKIVEQGLKALVDKYEFAKDYRGMGMLWALILEADPAIKLGTFIRDWCWDRNMILRNNGDIIVIAPSLNMPREDIDTMLNNIGGAIEAAKERFGL